MNKINEFIKNTLKGSKMHATSRHSVVAIVYVLVVVLTIQYPHIFESIFNNFFGKLFLLLLVILLTDFNTFAGLSATAVLILYFIYTKSTKIEGLANVYIHDEHTNTSTTKSGSVTSDMSRTEPDSNYIPYNPNYPNPNRNAYNGGAIPSMSGGSMDNSIYNNTDIMNDSNNSNNVSDYPPIQPSLPMSEGMSNIKLQDIENKIKSKPSNSINYIKLKENPYPAPVTEEEFTNYYSTY